MQMTGGGPGPEADLIRESVETASAKLRFFRIAFGPGGPQPVDLSEIGRIAGDRRRGSRSGMAWSAGGNAPRSEARLALLSILCVESAMPAGGSVRVVRDGGLWRIAGHAPTLRCEPSLWRALAEGRIPPDIDAARVHFAVLADAASAAATRLTVRQEEGAVTIEFRSAEAG